MQDLIAIPDEDEEVVRPGSDDLVRFVIPHPGKLNEHFLRQQMLPWMERNMRRPWAVHVEYRYRSVCHILDDQTRTGPDSRLPVERVRAERKTGTLTEFSVIAMSREAVKWRLWYEAGWRHGVSRKRN